MPTVTATLASIPERQELLEQTVTSLFPQVDRICVYLNGHRFVPGFLEHPKIRVATSRRHGDLGDAGKFFWAGMLQGIHLVCDDDIVYPPDYSKVMAAACSSFENPTAVGVHGFRFVGPIRDYFRSRLTFHASRALARLERCHVLGTGTLAYDTSRCRFGRGDFPVANMADLWFAVAAARRGIELWAVPREAPWLTMLPAHGTLFERFRGDAEHLTALANRVAWPAF